MKNQEHIEQYTRKIAQVLEKTPESEGALKQTLAEMSDAVIGDPRNMKRLLENISDLTIADSRSKTNLMLMFMEKHAGLLGNGELLAKIGELKEHMQSEDIHIRAQASLGTHDLRSALG